MTAQFGTQSTPTGSEEFGKASSVSAMADEDLARAAYYRLLAAFLTAPPTDPLLAAATTLTGDPSDLGRATSALAKAAGSTREAEVTDEYNALFIGLTRGELLPYASYYLTGFLHEKPLARLRSDMARLDIAADPSFAEPEDHVAAVFESMAGLIDGAFGEPRPLAEQRAFFEAHVASWAPLFFRDLAKAEAARLYRSIGMMGEAFLAVEQEAFRRD